MIFKHKLYQMQDYPFALKRKSKGRAANGPLGILYDLHYLCLYMSRRGCSMPSIQIAGLKDREWLSKPTLQLNLYRGFPLNFTDPEGKSVNISRVIRYPVRQGPNDIWPLACHLSTLLLTKFMLQLALESLEHQQVIGGTLIPNYGGNFYHQLTY